jgi:hypothetical protein
METLIVFGVFILLSFVIGVILGQKLNRNEKIEVNPVKAVGNYVEEKKIKKENDKEQAALETMLDNIDNYDGSGIGQKEIIR